MVTIIWGIYRGLVTFLNIIMYVLIAYGLMSWFVRRDSALYHFFSRFCEPILAPFRRVSRRLIEQGLMIDISIFLAVIAIQIIEQLLYRLLITLI